MHSLLRLRLWPRQVLLTIVRQYRRRWSGRGPWRGVRCTFERLESCSAFGERTLREAPGAHIAVLRIARRLQRCRHLSVYRLGDGSLVGGDGFDHEIAVLSSRLIADGELPALRQSVGRMALSLAQGAPSSPEMLVRNAAAVRSGLLRRARLLVLVAVLALVMGACARAAGIATFVAIGLFGPVILLAGLSALASSRGARRLEELELLSEIAASGKQ